MNKADKYLLDTIADILKNGYLDENPRPKYSDGTPAHTYSVNHNVRKYDLSKGEFPITSLRPIAWKSAIKEILWIYQEQSNSLKVLRDKYGVKYWNDWESKMMPNTIGARYGEVVRRYDLINELLKELVEDPFGRRHIIDLYQYKELQETDGLYPCAFLTIWNVRQGRDNKKYLDMCMVQRSGDMLTASGAGGVNEVQYAALLMMVARHCGYEAGMFTHFVANEQIYDRHIEQGKEMLKRGIDMIIDYKSNVVQPNPQLVLNPDVKNFFEIKFEDFTMENYEVKYPQLKFPLGI